MAACRARSSNVFLPVGVAVSSEAQSAVQGTGGGRLLAACCAPAAGPPPSPLKAKRPARPLLQSAHALHLHPLSPRPSQLAVPVPE